MFNKESFFISQIENKHIGDDGVIIGDNVYSKDLFCEGIHFKRSWMSLRDIASKSMLVNISDAIAMNATPKYALLGLKIPKNFNKNDLEELWAGFSTTSQKYSIEIIGGDTIVGNTLDISITIISTSKSPIYRDNIKQGQLLAYTGTLGSVQKDLKRLFQNKEISKTSKFITPILRQEFMQKASKYISSCMDISDGLCHELQRLSKANKISYKFIKNLNNNTLSSGEEYELVFSFDKKYLKIIKNISKKTKTPITIFAKAKRGSYKHKFKNHHI